MKFVYLEIMMKYFGIVLEEHDIVRKIDSEVVMGKEIIITGQQNFTLCSLLYYNVLFFYNILANKTTP